MNITQTGCYVDGHWGHYATAHMIMRATEFGFDDSEAIALAQKKLATMFPTNGPELADDEHEILSDMANETEAWLNENAAPEGHAFGWWEGEFYLWSNEDWEVVE